jgi:hypothetical protein
MVRAQFALDDYLKPDAKGKVDYKIDNLAEITNGVTTKAEQARELDLVKANASLAGLTAAEAAKLTVDDLAKLRETELNGFGLGTTFNLIHPNAELGQTSTVHYAYRDLRGSNSPSVERTYKNNTKNADEVIERFKKIPLGRPDGQQTVIPKYVGNSTAYKNVQ